jgi:hypothetical protein
LAVSVYVVVSLGYTCRLPRASTVPMPEIEISVASLTVHRSVADWPRSMVLGSAEN